MLKVDFYLLAKYGENLWRLIFAVTEIGEIRVVVGLRKSGRTVRCFHELKHLFCKTHSAVQSLMIQLDFATLYAKFSAFYVF